MNAKDASEYPQVAHTTNGLQPKLKNCTSELIILGTGSAMPSKYRNVSGMMLFNVETRAAVSSQSACYGHVLLDCGEGTYGQMWNVCKSMALESAPKTQKTELRHLENGLSVLNNVLKAIQVVWISHKHADHLLGLPQVLSAR
jgi:ribonuclease Z